MKKMISVMALASLFAAGSAMASGYRIPEQSVDSTAKSGANVASADSADMSYYNPAGMAWAADTWQIEGTATYLHLTPIDYEDNRTPAFNGSSNDENFLLPTFFLVSPDYNNFRFGFAFVEPFGLAKRWQDDFFPKIFADKFELAIFEFNPTVSYKIGDMLSIAGGVRVLYNQGTVMNNGPVPGMAGLATSRYLDVDATELGYNLGVDLRANDNWNFALTYRSNVDIDFEGDALLAANVGPGLSSGGSVTLPAPDVLTFSAAYTCNKWTFDLTIDQTFWSELDVIDFEYDAPIFNPLLFAVYGQPLVKNWDDTVAIRLGVDYELDPKTTLMAGIAYDENPIPDTTLSFDLPDSDAWLFSIGAAYKVDEQLEVGVGLLYDYKEERDVVNSIVNGTYSNASAFLLSFGVKYAF